MKTVVEGMLPARFLTEYGVYIQTCAHIEHACWTIYKLADPRARKLEGTKGLQLVKDKLSTRGLLRKFKASFEYCPLAIQPRILTVYDRIIEGLEARNTAAHGAWFIDGSDNSLKVEHYFIRESDQKGTWRHYEEPITQQDVSEAVENADQILRELVSIRTTLENVRT